MGDEWQRIEREAFTVESRAINWPVAVVGALVTSIPLAVGATVGNLSAGLYAGLGSLNVGLAISGSSLHRRAGRGAATLVATATVTALATALHPSARASVVATVVITGLLALTSSGDRQDSLVGFVIAAVFVIVNGLPADVADAPVRALQFSLGGGVALVLFLLVTPDAPEPSDRQPLLRTMRDSATTAGDPVQAHAVRIGLTTGLGTTVYRALGLSFGYWIPLSTLAVLQPDGHTSRVRALQRTTGTLLGTAAVAVIAAITDQRAVLIVLVAGYAFGLFALRGRSYHWLVTLLTPTALLMISTRVDPGADLVADRLANTAMGIALALAAVALTLGPWRAGRRLRHPA